MNKKLIFGLIGMLVVGSLVVVGTRAYFSQQGTVKSNTFSTGRPKLYGKPLRALLAGCCC